MAFRYNEFGRKVSEQPQQAHSRLVELFAIYGNDMGCVAAELCVNRLTLFRWMKRLAEAGYKDPRTARKTGGRRRRSVAQR